MPEDKLILDFILPEDRGGIEWWGKTNGGLYCTKLQLTAYKTMNTATYQEK